MATAAGGADAARLRHRRRVAQRVRHGRDKARIHRRNTGLLRRLDREELQGVIGHEMSHVRNYDIRFSLLVGVLVGGISLLAQFFLRWTFWFGGGSRRGTAGTAAA